MGINKSKAAKKAIAKKNKRTKHSAWALNTEACWRTELWYFGIMSVCQFSFISEQLIVNKPLDYFLIGFLWKARL
jgi:hypothetical protein